MKKLLYYIIFTQLFIYSSTLYTQWSTDPYNNLIVGYGLLPEIASDSTGGCYLTYEQNLGYPRHLAMERLNKYGYKTWSSTITISGELPEQRYSHLIADGYSGTIIAYLDLEFYQIGGISRLRLQRVDSSGNLLWGSNGVRASLAEANQDRHTIVSDEEGGCVVAWLDSIDVLRIQRIDAQGLRVWGDSGIIVSNNVPDAPIMISNKLVGVIIEYYSRLNGYKVQRINLLGQNLWGDGINVPTGAVTAGVDNIGNIYLFGGKFIGYNGSVNVWTANLQKLSSAGLLFWDSSGIFIDTIYDGGGLSRNRIVTDPNGTSFLAWDNIVDTSRKVFGQIVSASGIPLSTLPFMVNSVSSDEWTPEIIMSEPQSAIYMWRDYDQTPSRLYIQRFNLNGSKMWDTINVTASTPTLTYEEITTDCNGGCIIVGSQEEFSIRAQQVNKNGILGEVITNVADNNKDVPEKFRLYQNYPNPFNSSTIIRYDVPEQDWVTIKLFNLLGQEVTTLSDKVHLPGTYNITISSNNLSSGIYFYQLKTNKKIFSHKLTIIK